MNRTSNCRPWPRQLLGGSLTGRTLLLFGLAVCAGGVLLSHLGFLRMRGLPVHRSMAEVSNIIWETQTHSFSRKFPAALCC